MKNFFIFSLSVVLLCSATLTAAQNVDDLVGVGGTPVAQGEMREPHSPATPATPSGERVGEMEEPERTPSPQRATPQGGGTTKVVVDLKIDPTFVGLPTRVKERVVRLERTIRYLPVGGATTAQVVAVRADLAALRREIGGKITGLEQKLQEALKRRERSVLNPNIGGAVGGSTGVSQFNPNHHPKGKGEYAISISREGDYRVWAHSGADFSWVGGLAAMAWPISIAVALVALAGAIRQNRQPQQPHRRRNPGGRGGAPNPNPNPAAAGAGGPAGRPGGIGGAPPVGTP